MKKEERRTLSEAELDRIRGGVCPAAPCRQGACDPDGNIEELLPPAECGDPQRTC